MQEGRFVGRSTRSDLIFEYYINPFALFASSSPYNIFWVFANVQRYVNRSDSMYTNSDGNIKLFGLGRRLGHSSSVIGTAALVRNRVPLGNHLACKGF
jgi:hypothetical protein